MLSSILCGLDHAEREGLDAVLVQPVDHPLVEGETVDRVIAALQAGAAIAVPSYEGRRGHPAGFARAIWPELHAAPKTEGARAVLAAEPGRVVHVPGDAGSLRGANTPEEYELLKRCYASAR
jgi:molybdenum cofactor cytidylyltransferase